MATPHRIVRAWFDSLHSGIVELDRDWTAKARPRFSLGESGPRLVSLAPALGLPAALSYGYFLHSGETEISFVLPLEHGCDVDPIRDKVYLAGDFNRWGEAMGSEDWRMRPAELEGERVLQWKGNAERFLVPGHRFKFVTGENQWLVPPDEAPNTVRDEHGNTNRVVDPHRTGRHMWRFTLGESLRLSEPGQVGWGDGASAGVPLRPGTFFFELKTAVPLGALVSRDQTTFRIFAPRARSVAVYVSRPAPAPAVEAAPTAENTEPAATVSGLPALPARGKSGGAAAQPPKRPDEAKRVSLALRSEPDAFGVWEATLPQNLHGWSYWYSVDGAREGPAADGFDPKRHVLDPYAQAAVSREGPGLILDPEWVGRADRSFRPPAWHDLVMAEAHLRDLAAAAPIDATAVERRGFTGLRKWVESEHFYLSDLGVNCVELQPVHEFDSVTPEEYHWGYMTNNFFAPASSYALEPEKASGVRELQALVAAFHRRGIAVVLDVVYNHVGVPAHLMFVDKLYYFELDANGALANWSGCGNDLRARSAMARRLIIDSCLHYMQVYGIDGFRFDLAELLGVAVLREIEAALKKADPSVILIAEPWSFRGHIAGALRDTGWTSWNDGYRDFVRDYVRGNGGSGRMEYYLRGAPWYFAKWPAQTVNYTESHDDRTWIDVITENANHNGFAPTANDRRRTHLMAAILFMSLGIPMLAAGQDFLRSKHGVSNTYLRGDLNAFDYRRLHRYLATHVYFADWIAFRRGNFGRLLRQGARPSEGFFRFIHAEGSPALAVVYNADFSQGPARLLFAVNPTLSDLTIPLGENMAGGWDMLADQDRFYLSDAHGATKPVEAQMWAPALSCGLWVSEEKPTL